MMMKKISGILLLLCIGLFTNSCKKNSLDVNFNVSDTENFTIPPNSILSLPSILTPAFPTSSWQGDFQNNNTDKDHVKVLKLKTLTLTITNPQGKTFGFIKSVNLYIQASNLPETKIAYIDNNPQSAGQVLHLTCIDVDLSAYAKSDSFTLKVDATPQQTNVDNVDVRADLNFAVTAAVL